MISHPWCSGDNSIREDKQIEAHQLEDILKKPNDLQSKHILEKEQRHRRGYKTNSVRVSSPDMLEEM